MYSMRILFGIIEGFDHISGATELKPYVSNSLIPVCWSLPTLGYLTSIAWYHLLGCLCVDRQLRSTGQPRWLMFADMGIWCFIHSNYKYLGNEDKYKLLPCTNTKYLHLKASIRKYFVLRRKKGLS